LSRAFRCFPAKFLWPKTLTDFVQLTGEVGAGKPTICRALLEHLGPNYATALILNPD